MTTYRLPGALGGGEAELIQWNDSAHPSFASLKIDGVVILVPQEHLTEVKPPLPPEPPNGSVVSCDAGYFHIRQGPSWTRHYDGYSTWSQLCAAHREPLTRLVPDPFAPVELPWESAPRLLISRVARSTVEVRDSGRIRDFNEAGDGKYLTTVDWTPDGARAKARALWAAAEAVETAAGGTP